MKKVFIIFGANVGGEFVQKEHVMNALPETNHIELNLTSASPHAALAKVIDLLRQNCPDGYHKAVVVYVGENLYLLRDNLPCDRLDLGLLKRKLMEVTDGYKTRQQIETVNALFIGGIHKFLSM